MSLRFVVLFLSALIAAIPFAAPPSFAQGAIRLCSTRSSASERDPLSEAGIRCRRQNIDLFVQGLRQFGGYDTQTLQNCLARAKAELLGQTGYGRGGGKRYFDKLNECRRQANEKGISAQVDSAISSNPDDPQDTPQDGNQGDCDAACAEDLIRQFADEVPEPGEE